MAAIGSTGSIGAGTGADIETSKKQTEKTEQVASKETFLQLLVAQIKNQNPLSPADGVQFLTQLAQFTELEQLMDMRTDLSKIRESLTAPAKTEETGKSTSSEPPAGTEPTGSGS
jgi:flagellar basal-body rod modification protein FlgD